MVMATAFGLLSSNDITNEVSSGVAYAPVHAFGLRGALGGVGDVLHYTNDCDRRVTIQCVVQPNVHDGCVVGHLPHTNPVYCGHHKEQRRRVVGLF